MSELRNRMIQDMKLAGGKFFYLNTLGYEWPLPSKKSPQATPEAVDRLHLGDALSKFFCSNDQASNFLGAGEQWFGEQDAPMRQFANDIVRLLLWTKRSGYWAARYTRSPSSAERQFYPFILYKLLYPHHASPNGRRRGAMSPETKRKLEQVARPVRSIEVRRQADGMVVFRSAARAAEALQTNKHALSQRVWRLRAELHKRHWNPFLLERECTDHSDSKLRFRTREKVLVIEPAPTMPGSSS